MADAEVFGDGGYRYVKGVFQYSAGVAAESGFEIHRVRLHQPVPLAEGFTAAALYLRDIGRPLTAFCACELRSPAPFSEGGFEEFNRQYVATLEAWGLYRDGINPVARTNVCPLYNAPAAPLMSAFSVAARSNTTRGSFIIAGGGEAREGGATYRESIVRLGDTSTEGMREKIRYVASEMERRLSVLGFGWRDAVSVQAYTVHDIGTLLGEELIRRCSTDMIAWHLCRPPIVNLEFEMDVRGAAREIAV